MMSSLFLKDVNSLKTEKIDMEVSMMSPVFSNSI